MNANHSQKIKSSLRSFAGTFGQATFFLAIFLGGLSFATLLPRGNNMIAVLGMCAILSASLIAAVWATYAMGWIRVKFETQAIPVEPRHLPESLTRQLQDRNFQLHIIASEKNPRLSEKLALSIGNHVFLHESYLHPHRISEFTAVLGHEVAHVLLQHSRKKVWHSLTTSMGALIAFLAITLVTTVLFGSPTTGLFGLTAALLSVWSLWRINHYSRRLEFEADHYSVANLGVSVFDVECALSPKFSGEIARFSAFQTHPSGNARIEALKSAA